MAENNSDDPWAELRNASREPEAGRFAYEEDDPDRRVSTWGWIKFSLRVEVPRWLKKQFPAANKSLDSSYYMGITRQKKATAHAVKMAFGQTPEKQVSRTPVIVLGRRLGIPGVAIGSFLIIVVIAVIRHLTGL